MEDRRRPLNSAEAARRFQRELRTVAPRERYSLPEIQYDESGYPVERERGLAARVRRLITG
jgi:hypothetical protein